jgi:protein-S-isoprenylcysteine O-methyltransferase Ste14
MNARAANTLRDTSAAPAVSAWRHARAIALLPFMNTVVIPTAILLSTDEGAALPLAAAIAAALVGAVLLVAGVTLVVHSIRLFVRGAQGTLAPWDPSSALLTDGAYGYLRNPMKAGLFLVLLAEAVLLRSPPLLVWFGVFAAANVVYIRVSEEPALRERFGSAYERYCESVPRWLPHPRSVLARRGRQGASE